LKDSTHSSYLQNIDALRFLAFMAVFLAHAFQMKWENIPMSEGETTIRQSLHLGVLGVNFFFVLSGFLITRLLLIEKFATHSLDIKSFYLKRVKRIFPLYFIIIGLSALFYFLFQVQNQNTHWIYFIFFSANFHMLIFGYPYLASLTYLWSISVEEQFYLLWAPIIKYINRNYFLVFFSCILLISLIFRFYYLYHGKQYYFNTLSIMSDFAIGGLAAYFILNQKVKSVIESLSKEIILLGYLIVLGVFFFYNYITSYSITIILERIILSTTFIFIILEQSYSKNSLFKLGRWKLINYSGKISYGLYMYHAFSIMIAQYVFEYFNVLHYTISYMFLFPLLALTVTFIFSIPSYEFIERKILGK